MSMVGKNMRWRQAGLPDLRLVWNIQAIVHASFPEDEAVFADRLTLCPQGCFVLEMEGEAAGYVLTHPWMRAVPPALNTLLGNIPPAADTWYIHDLALLPHARGTGAAGAVVPLVKRLCEEGGLQTLSLVAVNGSSGFWEKQGFVERMTPELVRKVASYGDGTLYMERAL